MTAPLCFVAKGIHAALGAQMRVGAGLEVIIVTTGRTGCIKVARWARCIVAWATVVELTGLALTRALTWLAIAITCRTVIARWAVSQLLGALAVARRAVPHTVTAHMTIGTRGATAASGFGVANALHHFTACGFCCSGHHVTAWRLA